MAQDGTVGLSGGMRLLLAEWRGGTLLVMGGLHLKRQGPSHVFRVATFAPGGRGGGGGGREGGEGRTEVGGGELDPVLAS